MNQNHTMYSSSGKSFYFLLFTITEKWYIYVWHIHLESPTSALFSIITAQIMASNLTVQNFFDSDLPEFNDKSITTPARSDTDGATQLEEAQNVITGIVPVRAKNNRQLEAGKSTQAWATEIISTFQVQSQPTSHTWRNGPRFMEFTADFLSKQKGNLVPNQPPKGNVCTNPTTEQDVVYVIFNMDKLKSIKLMVAYRMAWSLQVSVPIFNIIKDYVLGVPKNKQLRTRVNLEVLNEAYVKSPADATTSAGKYTHIFVYVWK